METDKILINYYKEIMKNGTKGKYFALVENKKHTIDLVKLAEEELKKEGINVIPTKEYFELKELILKNGNK